MESTETDVVALINKEMNKDIANTGLNIYIDYITPAYHITTQLRISLFRFCIIINIVILEFHVIRNASLT